MYETLLRPHEVQQLPPPRPLGQVIDKLKRMELYREEKRQRQIANAGKRKRDEDDRMTGMGMGLEGGTEKRARVATESITSALVVAEESDERVGSGREVVPPPAQPEEATTSAVAVRDQADVLTKLNLSKVSPDVRGHTSYLTFARLVPFPLSLPSLDPSIQGQDHPLPTTLPSTSVLNEAMGPYLLGR